jgi:hypothetical protein
MNEIRIFIAPYNSDKDLHIWVNAQGINIIDVLPYALLTTEAKARVLDLIVEAGYNLNKGN